MNTILFLWTVCINAQLHNNSLAFIHSSGLIFPHQITERLSHMGGWRNKALFIAYILVGIVNKLFIYQSLQLLI